MFNPISLFAPCLLLFVLLGGCGASDAPQATHTIEERNGTTVVTNTDAPVWEGLDEAPIHLEQTQTYGAAEEPEEAMLAGVRSAAVDDDGVLYVLDRDNHRIVAFNPDGSIHWTAGTEGQGPGELQSVMNATLDGTGQLWLIGQRQKLDVWDTEDGSFINRHDLSEFGLAIWSLIGADATRLVLTGVDMETGATNVLVLDTETLDEQHRFETDLIMNFPLEYFPYMQATYHDGHIYTSAYDTYRLRQYTPEGTLVREITQPDVENLIGMAQQRVDAGVRFMIYSALSVPYMLPDKDLTLAWSFGPADLRDPEAGVEHDEVTYQAAIDWYTGNDVLQGRVMWDDTRQPPIGRPVAVGPEGTLFTASSEPFPQVRRYDVSLDN